MMHIANPSTVVTLEDANTGKPFREYDHSRTPAGSYVRVVLPFDTEYRFRFQFPTPPARAGAWSSTSTARPWPRT